MKTQVRRVKYIGIRVSPDTYEQFKLAAQANHRSLEGEVKSLIEGRIATFEAELEKAA